jgi:hypothetical protein
MLTEIFSLIGLVVVSVLMYLQHRTYTQQVNDLIKAVMAKNANEFIDLKRSDKKTEDKPYEKEEINLSELDDDKWLDAISK